MPQLFFHSWSGLFYNKISKSLEKSYDFVAKKYAKTFDNDIYQPYFDKFLSYLKSGDRILDVGCGPGTSANYFSKRGFEVTGIDISSEMLKLARKGTPKTKFKKMDMHDLKFEKNSFNSICAMFSLLHVPKKNMMKVLSGFKRVLVDRGYLFLAVCEGDGEKVLAQTYIKTKKVKMFFSEFSIKEIKDYLTKSDFEILWLKTLLYNSKALWKERHIYIIARSSK